MARHSETTYRLPPIRRRSNHPSPGSDWRCTECNALLGRIKDGMLNIRFGRRHEYVAALPATCTCRGCGGLNRVTTSRAR
jgi:hypothetical protein